MKIIESFKLICCLLIACPEWLTYGEIVRSCLSNTLATATKEDCFVTDSLVF